MTEIAYNIKSVELDFFNRKFVDRQVSASGKTADSHPEKSALLFIPWK